MDSRPFRVTLVVAAVASLAFGIAASWLRHQVGRIAEAYRGGWEGVTALDVLHATQWANAAGWCTVMAPCLIVLLGLGLHWALRPIRALPDGRGRGV